MQEKSLWFAVVVNALVAVGCAWAQGPASAPPPGKAADSVAQPKQPTDAATPADRNSVAWWPPVHESFNTRAKQGAAQGDIDLIFLGDSITMGWSKAGKGVWEEFYAKRKAVNFGIGGDRTQHVLWRLDHGNVEGLSTPAKGTPPKLVVLMIGTNNAGANTAAEIAEGVKAVVGKLRERLPTTKVLLLGIFPREAKPNATRERVQTASTLASGVADGMMVHFMDIGPSLREADGSIKPEIMPDFLHLSEEGYRRWAMAIEPKVKELMGEAGSTAPSGEKTPGDKAPKGPATTTPGAPAKK